MKLLQPLSICAVAVILGCSQETQTAAQVTVSPAAMSTLEDQTIEVGCGMCVYTMPDVFGCQLAAVVDGEPILVKGVDLDLHGHGLCSGSKSAVVSGVVEGKELLATKVEVEEPSSASGTRNPKPPA